MVTSSITARCESRQVSNSPRSLDPHTRQRLAYQLAQLNASILQSYSLLRNGTVQHHPDCQVVRAAPKSLKLLIVWNPKSIRFLIYQVDQLKKIISLRCSSIYT